MSQLDPNQNLKDARQKLGEFIEKRGSIIVDNILQMTLQDTKIIMILMALGLDPEKEILSSIAKEINKRLSIKGDSNANHS